MNVQSKSCPCSLLSSTRRVFPSAPTSVRWSSAGCWTTCTRWGGRCKTSVPCLARWTRGSSGWELHWGSETWRQTDFALNESLLLTKLHWQKCVYSPDVLLPLHKRDTVSISWMSETLFLCPSVPDRRQQWRSPLHGRHKRQPHHALQHPHHGVGSWALQVSEHHVPCYKMPLYAHVFNSFTTAAVLFRYFDVPMGILPEVKSSSEIYGWMVRVVNSYGFQGFSLYQAYLETLTYLCLTVYFRVPDIQINSSS